MKKICSTILLAAFIIILFLVSSCDSRSQQQVYNGKSVSEWVGDLDLKKPKDVRDQAQENLRQIGTNAIPFLLKEMSDLGELWQKIGVTNFDDSQEDLARLNNVRLAFKTLGPIAKPAFPALVDMLNSGKNTDSAALALTQIDPQLAVVTLTDDLTNKFIGARIAAAGYLFEVRSNADIALAVPNLVQCLKDESPDKSDSFDLIITAADTLRAIHARPDIAVPALVGMLTNTDWIIRIKGAQALGQFGNAAIFAVPALEQATNDPERRVRVIAAFSLKQIQSPSP
jgi:HEAT repeat protein